MNEELIRSALDVLDNSYAPYSGFHVAAAVLARELRTGKSEIR